jgi:hypothetical protein
MRPARPTRDDLAMTSAALTHSMPIRAIHWGMLPSVAAAVLLGAAALCLLAFAVALPLAVGQAEGGALVVPRDELATARSMAGMWPVLVLGAILHGAGALGALDRSAPGKLLALVAAILGGGAVVLALLSLAGGPGDLTSLLPISVGYTVAILAAVAIETRDVDPLADSWMAW